MAVANADDKLKNKQHHFFFSGDRYLELEATEGKKLCSWGKINQT